MNEIFLYHFTFLGGGQGVNYNLNKHRWDALSLTYRSIKYFSLKAIFIIKTIPLCSHGLLLYGLSLDIDISARKS